MLPSWVPVGSRYIRTKKFNHDRAVPKLTIGMCCSSGGATLHDGHDYRINCDPIIKTQLMTKLANPDNKTHFINA